MPVESSVSAKGPPVHPLQPAGRMAVCVALAAALSLVERFLPLPVPWMKPGLANIVIILLLINHGFRDALFAAILKTFAVALFVGGLFAPGHLLALSGSVVSTLMMALLLRVPRLGIYGISAAGAWAHSAAQLLCAHLLFVSWPVVTALAPPFLLFSLGAGLLTGHLVRRIAPRVREGV